MSFEHFERGYLLPKGCKDLIDVIGLHAESKLFFKLPSVHSKPQTGISLKTSSPAPAMKGDLFVSDNITVKELADLLGQKAFKIIDDTMAMGILAYESKPLSIMAVSHLFANNISTQ